MLYLITSSNLTTKRSNATCSLVLFIILQIQSRFGIVFSIFFFRQLAMNVCVMCTCLCFGHFIRRNLFWLQNGVLLRTALDNVTGDLSDTRTRYLGTRPVKLFRVVMQVFVFPVSLAVNVFTGFIC